MGADGWACKVGFFLFLEGGRAGGRHQGRLSSFIEALSHEDGVPMGEFIDPF